MSQGIESIPCHKFLCCSNMATFQHTLSNMAFNNVASNMLPSVCPALLYKILFLVNNCMYSGHLSALTPGFPMIFTCLPAAPFAFIHDTFIQLPHVHESVYTNVTEPELPQEICSRRKNTLILKLFPRKCNSINYL